MNSVIETFPFNRDSLGEVTLNEPSIRLNVETSRLTLHGGYLRNPIYPLAGEYYARHRLWLPEALTEWRMLEVVGEVPDGCSYGLRLYDGTNERRWNGSSWVIAAPGEWNTQVEVNQGLSSWPLTAALAVEIRLQTTDQLLTPSIEYVKILIDTEFEPHEEALYRSLIPSLREGIEPVLDIQFLLSADSTTFDLTTLQWEETFEIRSLAAVFNITDDPFKKDSVLASYDVGTKVITFSAEQAEGSEILVKAVCRPVVAFETDRDFDELPYLPAIVIDGLRTVKTYKSACEESIQDNVLDVGWLLEDARREDWRFDLKLLSHRGVDQARLRKATLKFLETCGTIRLHGLDTDIGLVPIGGMNSELTVSEMGVLQDSQSCELRAIPFPFGVARSAPIVKSLVMNFGTGGS